MDVRGKLVELLAAHCDMKDKRCIGCEKGLPEAEECKNSRFGKVAEDLIAHSVTVQEWVSVIEPPKENGYYLCYVLTSAVGDKVKYEQMPLYWEDDIWLYLHNSYRMCRNVTHWQYLPQPPKGE